MSGYLPSQEQVTAAVRWLATVIGAWMVSRGYVDSDQAIIIGGILTGIGALIWSLVLKTEANRLKSAAAVPDVTVVVGTAAPASSKALADNPKVTNIVRG